MQDDFLYVVVRNNGKDQLLKYAIKMDSNTFGIEDNRVHLDHLMEIPKLISGTSTPTVLYDADTNKSAFAKPTGLESTNQLVAFDNSNESSGIPNLGRYGQVTVNGNVLELQGDWTGEVFLIGYQYTMEVEIPTIYVTKQEGEAYTADSRANTVLHRAIFAFGPVGVYQTILTRVGRSDFTQLFEITPANEYIANTSTVLNDNKLYSIPIYDRNTNIGLSIKSTHPTPATILYMTWEGIYNNNFYTRV